MTIHKSATKAGSVRFTNGNETTFWIGQNSNTGQMLVWQRTHYAGNGGQTSRVTGSNIGRLYREVEAALKAGECTWVYRDAASLAYLAGATEGPPLE